MHAAGVAAVQAVQRHPGMGPANFRDDAEIALLGVGIGHVGNLDAVAQARLLDGQADQMPTRLGRQEGVAGGEIVGVDIGAGGGFIDLETAVVARHADLAAAQRPDVQPGHAGGMDDDLFQPALIQGAADEFEMRVVEGIEGAEKEADAAAREAESTQIRQQPQAEDDDAEADAAGEKDLARHAEPGRGQGRHHDVGREPDQHVEVIITDAALKEENAEILRALRGQRGDHGGAQQAAHRGNALGADGAAGDEHRQSGPVEGELGAEAGQAAGADARGQGIRPLLDAAAEPGKGGQKGGHE